VLSISQLPRSSKKISLRKTQETTKMSMISSRRTLMSFWNRFFVRTIYANLQMWNLKSRTLSSLATSVSTFKDSTCLKLSTLVRIFTPLSSEVLTTNKNDSLSWSTNTPSIGTKSSLSSLLKPVRLRFRARVSATSTTPVLARDSTSGSASRVKPRPTTMCLSINTLI
jgi:hypothetical protein